MSTKTEILLTRLVTDHKAEWTDLVNLIFTAPQGTVAQSFADFISEQGKVGIAGVKRKIGAILYARESGHSAEDVIAQGQERTLSQFQKASQDRKDEKDAHFTLRLPGSLAKLLLEDVYEITRILHLKNSAQVGDFLHALLLDLRANPKSLLHLAGELSAKAPDEKGRPVHAAPGKT